MPAQPLNLGTQVSLRVHGIQGQNAPTDPVWRQERFERADLVLFSPNIAMPQDDARSDLVTTQVVDGMRLGSGGANGFAIQGQVPVIGLPLWRAL